MNSLIIACALALLAGLLYFAKKESISGQLLTKPFLSLLFIAAAILQPHQGSTYFHLILTGLVLCLIGDVCLIFLLQKDLHRRTGVLSCRACAVCDRVFQLRRYRPLFMDCRCRQPLPEYRRIFVAAPQPGGYVRPGNRLCRDYYRHGHFRGRAHQQRRPWRHPRTLVFGGAVLFYFSDIFVARQRFVKKAFFNRAAGLPMYYAAQFMIAFSTGMI